MDAIRLAVQTMDPEEALAALAGAAVELLGHLGDEARLNFLAKVAGESQKDKVASMVHL